MASPGDGATAAAGRSSRWRRRRPRRTRAKRSWPPSAPRRRRSSVPTSRRRPSAESRWLRTRSGPTVPSTRSSAARSTAAGWRSAPAIARSSATRARFNAHAGWSLKNYKVVDAQLALAGVRERPRHRAARRTLARRAGGGVLRRRQHDHAATAATTPTARRRPARRRACRPPLRGVRRRAGHDRHRLDRMRVRPIDGATRSPSSTGARRRATRAAAARIAWIGRTIRHEGRTEQLPPRRRRGQAVHPAPPRELGDRASRGRLHDRRGRRPRRAVLPDAGARRQPHASRIRDLALPRPQPPALHRRVSAGPPARSWTWRSSSTPARSPSACGISISRI